MKFKSLPAKRIHLGILLWKDAVDLLCAANHLFSASIKCDLCLYLQDHVAFTHPPPPHQRPFVTDSSASSASWTTSYTGSVWKEVEEMRTLKTSLSISDKPDHHLHLLPQRQQSTFSSRLSTQLPQGQMEGNRPFPWKDLTINDLQAKSPSWL